MPSDNRITHLIGQLRELRELFLVIDQSGEEVSPFLLKLAREKAEEIFNSTNQLRSPEFWAGLDLQALAEWPEDSTPADALEPVEDVVSAEETSWVEETPQEAEVNEETTTQVGAVEVVEEIETVGNVDIAEDEMVAPEEDVDVHLNDEDTTPDNEDTAPGDEDTEPIESFQEPQPLEETVVVNESEKTYYPWEHEEENEFVVSDELVPSKELEVSENAEPITLEEVLQRRQAKELRKALSLNDKFRFRRELFGNSDVRMTETLALIDAMSSYEEAEDYIFNDLGWDAENPEVVEFMNIVQKRFL